MMWLHASAGRHVSVFTWVWCSHRLAGADVGITAMLILVLVLMLVLVLVSLIVSAMLCGPDATLVTTLEGRGLPLRSWFEVKTCPLCLHQPCIYILFRLLSMLCLLARLCHFPYSTISCT